MSRTTARELALKLTFELSFQDDDAKDLYERYLETCDEAAEITNEDEEYILGVLCGIKENVAEIDEKIKAHLKDWNFERISKIDLAILRLSIFEILYREDIPYKVAINEAVELSKSFGDDSSPSFVNGVLAKIVEEIN